MLTACTTETSVRSMVAASVVGYVLKKESPETLVHAIRAVVQGQTWFSQAVVMPLVRWPIGNATRKTSSVLTAREMTVLRLMMAGKTNREMGQLLGIAERTVRVHVRHVCSKFGVSTRIEAAVKAAQLRLLEEEACSTEANWRAE